MIELKNYQQTAVHELKELVVRSTNDAGFFCKSACATAVTVLQFKIGYSIPAAPSL